MKTYLGDGVYLELDSFGRYVLTTEDGISTSNRIVLEPEVYQNFILMADRLKAAAAVRKAHQ